MTTKDEFDLLIERRLYNELFGFGGKKQAAAPQQQVAQQDAAYERPQWLQDFSDSTAKPIQKAELVKLMQSSMGKINQFLGQAKKLIANAARYHYKKGMADAQKQMGMGQPNQPGSGIQQNPQTGQMMVGAGFMQKDHHDPAAELLDWAELFESLSQKLEYADEVANQAYFAWHLFNEGHHLSEYMAPGMNGGGGMDNAQIASTIANAGVNTQNAQAGQAGQAGQAQQTKQATQTQQATPETSPQTQQTIQTVGQLIQQIQQTVQGEFKTLAMELQKRGLMTN